MHGPWIRCLHLVTAERTPFCRTMHRAWCTFWMRPIASVLSLCLHFLPLVIRYCTMDVIYTVHAFVTWYSVFSIVYAVTSYMRPYIYRSFKNISMHATGLLSSSWPTFLRWKNWRWNSWRLCLFPRWSPSNWHWQWLFKLVWYVYSNDISWRR